MTTFIERLQKSRETTVSHADGRIKFRLRRPAYVDDLLTTSRSQSNWDIASKWLIGWEGVRENDILPSAMDEQLPFDLAVAGEWIKDDLALLKLLMEHIDGQRRLYESTKEAVEKN